VTEHTRTRAALPDLEDPRFLVGDRSAGYRALRDDAPVLALGDTWLLSRHTDVQAVLRTPTGRMQPPGLDAPAWMRPGPALRRLRANMVQTDRPVHDRLRHVVAPLFTAHQVEQWRAEAAREVATDLDDLGSEPFDAVRELAANVPRGVLRSLLGMPDEDWSMLVDIQHDFLMIFSPTPLPPAQQDRLDEVAGFYLDYFDALLGRTTEPTELVRRLLDAEDRGDLSHDEVLSLMHTVLDAGFETTRTSISNLLEFFATTPGLLDRVRRDEALVPTVVEESLRLRPPLHLMPRILAEDHAMSDGTVVPAGAATLCLIGAANLDERVFPDPDRFDPERAAAGRHLAFGGGLHHCLGAPLARLQLHETVRGLAQRFTAVELAGEPARYASLMFPSLSGLPVRLRP
jgi:cytochrome P450